MKNNSFNPFICILGKTKLECLQKQVLTLDRKMETNALESIEIEHQRAGLIAQINFIQEGQSIVVDDHLPN